MQTFIAVVIIFGVLVSFHEFGHLLLAKRAGILCREFAIGFGPKIFSIKKGETVYTLRLLPIGGFVRMAGEDPEIVEIKPGQRIGLYFNAIGEVNRIIINHTSKYPDARMVTAEKADLEKDLVIEGYETDEGELLSFPINHDAEYVMDHQAFQIAPLDRQFASKSLGQRFLAIFAGPLMNFILAFIILLIYFLTQGVPSDKPVLGQLTQGDPAMKSGLHQGDKVLSIQGKHVNTWGDIVTIVSAHPGDPLTFNIKRNGITKKIVVTPKERKVTKGQASGFIGVYSPTDYTVLGSIHYSFTQTIYWSKLLFHGFEQLVTGKVGINGLSGPVGIYTMTGQVAQSGIPSLMRWTAILSINLGIVNLLPLPALDGGRLLFLIIEGLRGKPVDPKRETLVHFIGFAFLMLLMIVVTWNDIQKMFLQ